VSFLPSTTAVAVGGALGVLARYGAARTVALLVEQSFPWSTWAVNLVGCLLIGLSVPFFGELVEAEEMRLLFVTGFLGSFTTFSTFSLDTFALWTDGHGLGALANAAGSVVLGLVFVWMGVRLAELWM